MRIEDMRTVLSLVIIVLSFAPLTASAHPGHGPHPGDSVAHHLLAPEHSLVMLPALLLCAWLIRLVQKERGVD
jgi:hypothetical protein